MPSSRPAPALAKQTQGIDANALQNQSATAVAQVFNASQMRIKLIARIMAEGVRDIFALLHGTIRKHGQQQQTVRLRNAWVNVDPRGWKTRDDMTINVGLGAGGKAQQFAQTMALANVQKELIAGGKVNLVGDRELYNTAAELTRIMGHKNPDRSSTIPPRSIRRPGSCCIHRRRRPRRRPIRNCWPRRHERKPSRRSPRTRRRSRSRKRRTPPFICKSRRRPKPNWQSSRLISTPNCKSLTRTSRRRPRNGSRLQFPAREKPGTATTTCPTPSDRENS
jgi:hypothetical protein